MSFKIALQTVPLFLLILLIVAILIPSCAPNPDTARRVGEYNAALTETADSASDAKAVEGIQAFSAFLEKISDKEFVRENTAKVYAPGAYLNDTLVTHHGPEEIRDYFLATADTMSSYKVTVDDVASSGNEYYVRWTMIFSAPKLNGGEPVHSVGISHVRLNREGLVTLHQDFWDSGTHIYGQIPVLGGAIETIRRRFEK